MTNRARRKDESYSEYRVHLIEEQQQLNEQLLPAKVWDSYRYGRKINPTRQSKKYAKTGNLNRFQANMIEHMRKMKEVDKRG